MSLTVGSLFAGIGGFDLGFTRAGFDVRWQVESEPFCQKVLVKRFSHAVVYDDVCTVGAHNLERVDVICGGFPCQDLSVAGQRTGLGGDRSGLFWQMTRIAAELAPAWMVIENVPGLLTSAEGRDFHTVLSALADGGFRRSYRILDSRYFGVAQRRRRVFLVLRAGNARGRTRSVLFESTSGTGRAQTRKEARASVAATLRGRSAQRGVNEPGRGGEDDSNLVAIGVHASQWWTCRNGHQRKNARTRSWRHRSRSQHELRYDRAGSSRLPESPVTKRSIVILAMVERLNLAVVRASSGERARANRQSDIHAHALRRASAHTAGM